MTDRIDANSELTLDALAEELGSVREGLEGLARRDEIQKQAFDALYEELRQYKEDFIFQMEKPLLLDLLLFYDSLNWFQQSLLLQEMSPEVTADSFQYLLDEFLELLYRRDVLPSETRTRFDKRYQKAVKVINTDEADLDYQVQEVVKRGFGRSGRTLRPEEVVVYRYSPDGGSRIDREGGDMPTEAEPISGSDQE